MKGLYLANMFSGKYLSSIRKKALRKCVWYSTLDRVERGIINLTVRVVDKVDSEVLGVELVKILAKLVKALKSGFVRHMEKFGLSRVKELIGFAVAWGDGAAVKWLCDEEFAKYLTVLDLNKPSGLGAY